MANSTTLGNHNPLRFGKFKMDRQGLVTGTVLFDQTEPYNQPDWSKLSLSAAPALQQPCVDVERDYDFKKQMATYTYTYEGVFQSFTPNDSLCTFELDLTMSEDPIETHPNFITLSTKYAWNPQKRQFAQTAPGATDSSTGLGGGQKKKKAKSPLYGVDSYLAVGGSFRKSYISGLIPATALQGIGTIVAVPPGLQRFPLPATASKRNWLKLPPRITLRGNCVQVTEQWLMSGPNGWVKDIYSNAAMQDGSPDGLSSGSLSSGHL